MSRDIRSFFPLKKPAKPAAVVEDDDDITPESPDVQINQNKKKKRVLERRDKSEKTTTSIASKYKTEDSKKSTEKSDDKKQKLSSNTKSNKDLKKADESEPSKKTEDTKSLKKSESTESKQNNDKDHTKVKKADKDHKLPKIDKFIQSSIDSNEGNSSQDQSSKKKKLNKSMEAKSVLTDEQRLKKRVNYLNYRNRPEPKHLGAKEIPEGKPDCLKDCSFLMTEVLDSFSIDEIAAAITKYGGCVKRKVPKKVTHVLAGNAAGPDKWAKAQELGIKIINEDEFLAMITERSQDELASN